jgi:hypothetical protein
MRKDKGGRPSLGKTTEIVKLRVAGEDLRRWEREAARAGVSLSEWIRARCNR